MYGYKVGCGNHITLNVFSEENHIRLANLSALADEE